MYKCIHQMVKEIENLFNNYYKYMTEVMSTLWEDDRDYEMSNPWGVAVDSTGVVYVTDTSKNCVCSYVRQR